MKNPLVSLVIVNWNGKKYLHDCLKSLQKISYKEIEIIVVDQNSTDGSQEMMRKYFPKVLLIQNKENTGFVGGNNTGVAKAKGKYAMLLNNDTEVDKHFIEPLVEAMENDTTIGCVQPKAMNIRHRGKLDGGGSLFTYTGFLYHKGYLEDAKKAEFNKEYFVYSVKGAYMFFRRDVYLKLGGLDKDFFIYFEESDLCGRMWVAGFTVKYIPSSLVYHWGGGDTKGDWDKRFALVQYRSFKNRICSYIKNLSIPYLLFILPMHLVLVEGLSFYYFVSGGLSVFISLQKAIFWNISNIEKTLKKRKIIQQKFRKVTDREIFRVVAQPVSFTYYFHQLKLLKED